MLGRMRTIGTLCLMAVGVAGLATVSADAKPAPRPAKVAKAAPKVADDQKAVASAVEAFRAAMVRADGKTLTRLASPGLSFGHSNGLVQTRHEFISSVVHKKEIFRSIKLVNKKLRVYGGTAVSRHEFHADILLQGKPLNVKLKCIEVWDKTPAGWRLVSRQAYKTS